MVLEQDIYPSLVLVQPRKTRPCLTERLLIGRKESNQTKTKSTKLYEVGSQKGNLPETGVRSMVFLLHVLEGIPSQNSINPDQPAPGGAGCPGCTLFSILTQQCIHIRFSNNGHSLKFSTNIASS